MKKYILHSLWSAALFTIPVCGLGAPQPGNIIEDVTITSIMHYRQNDEFNVEVRFDLNDPSANLSTNCAPTDQLHMVTRWASNDFNRFRTSMVASLEAAMHTGSPVDLIIANNCSTSNAYPNQGGPSGRGRQLEGVRVHAR